MADGGIPHPAPGIHDFGSTRFDASAGRLLLCTALPHGVPISRRNPGAATPHQPSRGQQSGHLWLHSGGPCFCLIRSSIHSAMNESPSKTAMPIGTATTCNPNSSDVISNRRSSRTVSVHRGSREGRRSRHVGRCRARPSRTYPSRAARPRLGTSGWLGF